LLASECHKTDTKAKRVLLEVITTIGIEYMPKASITDAIRTLEELIASLDDAYWEASTLERKDRFYDIISILNIELSELAKLSIQDHHHEYEPITPSFRRANAKLTNLRNILNEGVMRSTTAASLEDNINQVIGLSGI